MAYFDVFEDDSPEPYAYGYEPAAEREPREEPPAGGMGQGAVANWAGALVSLGLIVGIGVWGWQLMARDVSDVPVVRAIEGPMRTAPADPGGAQAPHQGLAVNRIAEGSEAAPVPDRLVLAPPPIELQPVAQPEARAPETADPIEDPSAFAADLAAGVEPLEGVETIIAPPDAGVVLSPSPDGVDAMAEAPASADAAGASRSEIIPASVPGVSRSVRPSLRPASLVVVAREVAVAPEAPDAPAPTVAPPTAEDGVTEIAPGDLPAGTRLVQLGAFDSAEIARSEWTRLAGLFPDFLADRPRVIEEAISGGQRFFRLRAAGFDDLPASRRFCAELTAQGAACIPVTVR